MPTIHLETPIAAPIERAFDAMRDVAVHLRSAAASDERVVDGRRSGLFELGDEVTWEARHFAVRQRLCVRVTCCEPPHRFVDEMVHGAFARFTHTHVFRDAPDGCVMIDDFAFVSPLGVLGRIADALFLERYMRRFLVERARIVKLAAEAST